jgi:formylglycine-generating enzyme required for sulfatase activity
VTIGENVESIEERAFRKCRALKSITVLNPKPPTLGKSTFYGIDWKNACVYVPASGIDEYFETYRTYNWKENFKCIKEIAGTGAIPTPKPEDIKIEMVLVDGGTFTMGCTEEQGDECLEWEKKTESVAVRDFYIAKYECTQKLWKMVMGGNPSRFEGGGDLPVESVDWDTVNVFIRRLNRISGKRYRLPTEAEWEYAARGGNKSKGYKYSGSGNIDDIAWYKDNSGGKTHPVGTKKANELGIHDMSGNVWEWSGERYCQPCGLRGGSWLTNAERCCVSTRNGNDHKASRGLLGFRLVLDP